MRRIAFAFLLVCPLAYPQTPAPQAEPAARPAGVSQPQTAVQQPAPAAKVLSVENANGQDKDAARLTNRIYVRVQNLDQWLRPEDKVTSVILYLDDRPLPNVKADPAGPPVDSVRTLAFDLRLDGDQPQELETWRRILISARRANPDSVHLSVGLPGRDPIASDVRLQLKRAKAGYEALVILGLVLAVGTVIWLARTTDLLRDIGSAPSSGGKRPYSLGRTQMAIWFCLVLVGWTSISLVTMSAAQMSNSILALIGISAATGIAAVAVDVGKSGKSRERESMQRDIDSLVQALDGSGGAPGLRDQVLAARAIVIAHEAQAVGALAQQTPAGEATGAAAKPAPAPLPANLAALEVELAQKESRLRQLAAQVQALPQGGGSSEGWFKDILSDENGISFHRMQMLLWTLALGVYFAISVFKDLVMPEFDTQLLLLMGISSGTYVGFKLPEKPST